MASCSTACVAEKRLCPFVVNSFIFFNAKLHKPGGKSLVGLSGLLVCLRYIYICGLMGLNTYWYWNKNEGNKNGPLRWKRVC